MDNRAGRQQPVQSASSGLCEVLPPCANAIRRVRGSRWALSRPISVLFQVGLRLDQFGADVVSMGAYFEQLGEVRPSLASVPGRLGGPCGAGQATKTIGRRLKGRLKFTECLRRLVCCEI